jgi:hypothetical protein
VGGECERSVSLIIIKGQCQEIIDKVFFHESVQEQIL